MNAALLREAFAFTELDLAENKQRRLSARQRMRVMKKQRRRNITAVIAGVVCFAVGAILLLPIVQSMSIEGRLGPLVGGIVLVLLALLFFSGAVDKPPSEVDSVEGKAQFVRRESTTWADDVAISETDHYVVIGGHEFKVKPAHYEAFTQDHVYRVYYGPEPLGTLSIEYIGPPEE